MLLRSMSTIPLLVSFQHIALQAKNMVDVASPYGSIKFELFLQVCTPLL
jgi:hypothetical protein